MVRCRELGESNSASSDDELPPLTHGLRAPASFRSPNNENPFSRVHLAEPVSFKADSEEDDVPPVIQHARAKVNSRDTSDNDSLPPLVANQDYGSESKVSSDDDLPPVHGNNIHGAEAIQSNIGSITEAVQSTRVLHIEPSGFHSDMSLATERMGDDDDDEELPPLLPQTGWGHSGPVPASQACVRQDTNTAPVTGLASTLSEPAAPKEAQVSEFETGVTEPEDLRMARSRILSSRRVGDKQKVAAALLDAAEVQLRIDRAEEAMQGAVEARAMYKQLFNCRGEAEALRMAVKVHAKGGRYQEAKLLAEEQLALFHEVGERRAEAIMLLGIADLHLAQDHYDRACQSTAQALTIFQEVEDVPGEAKALEACAAANAASERWDRLISTATEASRKFEAADDTLGHANFLKYLAQAYLRSNNMDPEKARNAANQSLSLCKELGNKRGEAAALECLASAFLNLRDGIKEALRHVNKALAISKDINDARGELSACVLLANAWLAEEKQEEAMRAQKIALKLARDLGDQRQINEVIDIGLGVHFTNELPEKALAVVEEEVRIARKAKLKVREAHGLLKTATVKRWQGKVTEALRACEEAITIFQDVGEKRGEAEAQVVRAGVLMDNKSNSEALAAAREAEELFEPDIRMVVHCLQLQVDMYMEIGQHERALQQCYKQVRLFRDAGFEEDEASSQLGVAEVLSEVKGPKEALTAAKKALQMHEDMRDTRGMARTLINMAIYQANSQAPTDALRSATHAQTLSKELDDLALETEAMQVAAEVYLMQGSFYEAIRQSNAAVDASREAKDERQQAENCKKTAEVYLNVMRSREESGRGPDLRNMEKALDLVESSRYNFDIIGDKYGEASALIMQSNLHVVGREGEKAWQAAQTALEISISLNDEVGVANAYLAIAKAEVATGRAEQALTSVHEAQTCFKQVGDQQGLNECDEVIKAAQDLNKQGSIRRSQSAGRNLGKNSRDASGYDPFADEVPDSRQRRGFGREATSGQPSGYGSGSRSRSMPPEEPLSPVGMPSSSHPGRYPEPMLDSLPLPKSLNGFKGPQVGRLSDGGRALTEKLMALPKAGETLGFGRGAGFKLGFGRPDGGATVSPVHGYPPDSDSESQGPFGFTSHALDFDQKQDPRRMQRSGGLSAARRPLREVDGLD